MSVSRPEKVDVYFADCELLDGDIKAAFLLGVFRAKQSARANEGFSVTQEEITNDFYLSRFEFERTRKALADLDLVEYKRVGYPAKLEYRLTKKALQFSY